MTASQPIPDIPETPAPTVRPPSHWPGVVAIILLLGVTGIGFKAWSDAKRADEQAQLERQLASLPGHVSCKLGWIKAGGMSGTGGRYPDWYGPTEVSREPRVIDCPMVKGDAQAQPLRVKVRCVRKDPACVEVDNQA